MLGSLDPHQCASHLKGGEEQAPDLEAQDLFDKIKRGVAIV